MAYQLSRYFRDLSGEDRDVLDREEERKLACRVKAGNEKAKEKSDFKVLLI